MKKRILTTLAIVAVLMLAVSAVTFAANAYSARTIAAKYVPADAVHSYTHDDGHKYEVHFNANNVHYEVEVTKNTDNVIEVKMESYNDRGGRTVVINEAQVRNIIAKDFAYFNIHKIKIDNDYGVVKYEVSFAASGIRKGEYEINAETGAVIAKTIKY